MQAQIENSSHARQFWVCVPPAMRALAGTEVGLNKKDFAQIPTSDKPSRLDEAVHLTRLEHKPAPNLTRFAGSNRFARRLCCKRQRLVIDDVLTRTGCLNHLRRMQAV